MARKKHHAEEKENHERWLITYADLITLLMIFFVVMYAISTVNAQKLQAMAESLSAVLAGKSDAILDTRGPSIVEGKSGQQLRPRTSGAGGQADMEQVKRQIIKYIQSQGVKDPGFARSIIITEQERGLVISIKDTLLFPKGSAELTPRSQEIIYEVGKSLTQIPNYIRVEGHTDNLPIHTAQFPSNWELSVIRATNVARALIERVGIPPERLSATGYGEYRPLVPNDSEYNRSMNRRVDIVILKQKYDYFEPPKENAVPAKE